MDIQDPVNEVTLSGELVERALLRYTPAGIPILDARLAHGAVWRRTSGPVARASSATR